MAAAVRHAHPPPSRSLGTGCPPKAPGFVIAPCLCPRARSLPPPLRLWAPAAAAVDVAVPLASGAPPAAGDLSVLIPISTVLLVFYWVANFVVPWLISEDLRRAAEDVEREASAEDEG